MNRTAVILPVFNEEKNIGELLSKIEQHVAGPLDFIVVDDGSTDSSAAQVLGYRTAESNRKKLIKLTRNFGHQQAIMAGICAVPDDCSFTVVMDADFQDSPEDISALLEKLKEGYDCCYAVRTANSDSLLINFLTGLFYRIQASILSFTVPRNAGNFSAFNRAMLLKLRTFSESEVYFPGIRAYIGMRQAGVDVKRAKRRHGNSKMGLLALIRLSLASIMGFSAAPMRAVLLFGGLITLFCFILGFIILILRITGIVQVLGFTTLAVLILGLFGVQIMFTGLMGEYIGKLFIEAKKRPPWMISEVHDE